MIAVLCGLSYGVWTVIESHPKTFSDVIVAASAAMVVPEKVVFVVFRGLIVAVALYLLIDFILSFLRRPKPAEKEEPEDLWWYQGPPRKK